MHVTEMQNLQNRLIAKAADELGIQCELLIPGCEDFLQLRKQDVSIVINKTRSHRLPLMSGLLAKNKQAANQLLSQQGLPVPAHIVLSDSDRNEQALSFLESVSAAGQSLVVKPLDSSGGNGVTLDVRTQQQLAKAMKDASAFSEQILLQQYVQGNDYRVLVIDSKVVAVTEYSPAYLVGDGQRTIGELIDDLNRQHLRQTPIGQLTLFHKLQPDDPSIVQSLAEKGYTLDAVPETGCTVTLYSLQHTEIDKVSEFSRDCTDEIHAHNQALAIHAAQILNIDVAGIDIRCNDISIPLTSDCGGILEVNALPDFVFHVYPYEGQSRDVARRYVEYLFHQPVNEPVATSSNLQRSVH
ncbi:ATP-grasp domain-containing protein [Paenibacillus kandeliae]|uniref:ATP-grasp domain-containing protein n=1 Tax=Paenibacillus kandeliae TaxID=3231269 RepID=UPI00345991C7